MAVKMGTVYRVKREAQLGNKSFLTQYALGGRDFLALGQVVKMHWSLLDQDWFRAGKEEKTRTGQWGNTQYEILRECASLGLFVSRLELGLRTISA
jgi:hypothetical protein